MCRFTNLQCPSCVGLKYKMSDLDLKQMKETYNCFSCAMYNIILLFDNIFTHDVVKYDLKSKESRSPMMQCIQVTHIITHHALW